MALDDQAPAPLPCGVALDDLIAQVTAGAAPIDRAHQAACEFCQATIEAIRRAWEEFQDFARAAVAVPDDLADRAMRRVRELSVGESPGLVVDEQRGRTHVADRVLVAVSRAAAMSVPGVAWASATAPAPSLDTSEGLGVVVRLVVAWDVAIPQLAHSVRERVVELVATQTGAILDRVDVAVQDVVIDPENI